MICGIPMRTRQDHSSTSERRLVAKVEIRAVLWLAQSRPQLPHTAPFQGIPAIQKLKMPISWVQKGHGRTGSPPAPGLLHKEGSCV